MKTRTTITVRVTVPGRHKWPDAPDGVTFFLKYPHRHLFHISATWVVDDPDRSREFFVEQERIHTALDTLFEGHPRQGHGYDFGTRSCETIAHDLLRWFGQECIAVTVSEDGENDATVEVIDDDR